MSRWCIEGRMQAITKAIPSSTRTSTMKDDSRSARDCPVRHCTTLRLAHIIYRISDGAPHRYQTGEHDKRPVTAELMSDKYSSENASSRTTRSKENNRIQKRNATKARYRSQLPEDTRKRHQCKIWWKGLLFASLLVLLVASVSGLQ